MPQQCSSSSSKRGAGWRAAPDPHFVLWQRLAPAAALLHNRLDHAAIPRNVFHALPVDQLHFENLESWRALNLML